MGYECLTSAQESQGVSIGLAESVHITRHSSQWPRIKEAAPRQRRTVCLFSIVSGRSGYARLHSLTLHVAGRYYAVQFVQSSTWMETAGRVRTLEWTDSLWRLRRLDSIILGTTWLDQSPLGGRLGLLFTPGLAPGSVRILSLLQKGGIFGSYHTN